MIAVRRSVLSAALLTILASYSSGTRLTAQQVDTREVDLTVAESVLVKMQGTLEPRQELNLLSRLTVGFGERGDFEKALRYGRAAVDLSRRHRLQLPLGIALNNLGLAHRQRGDFLDARTAFEQSLQVLSTLDSRDDSLQTHLSSVENNLGLLDTEVSRHAAAAERFARAVVHSRRAVAASARDRGAKVKLEIVLANQGYALLRLNRPQAAEALLSEAITIAKQVDDGPGEAAILQTRGVALNDAGQHDQAIVSLQQALAISRKADAPIEEVATLHNLGFGHARSARPVEAERFFRESLARNRALGRAIKIDTLVELADAVDAQGRSAEARQFFDEALTALRRYTGERAQYLSEREQMAAITAANYALEMYLSFCDRTAVKDPSTLGRMYDALLWRKSMVVVAAAALRQRVESANAGPLFDEWQGKRADWLRLLREPRTAASIAAIRALDDEVLRLERTLTLRLAEAAGTPAAATWQSVRQRLKPDEAAVEFVRFRQGTASGLGKSYGYAALVLTPSGPVPSLVRIGSDAVVDQALRDYFAMVDAQSVLRLKGLGALASKTIWQSLEPVLRGAARVFVAPDGELHKVSWPILSGARGLLLDTVDVRVVSSTRDLLREPAAPSFATRRAVLVANPAYGTPTASASATAERVQGSRGVCAGVWDQLTGAANEAEAVGNALRRSGWQIEALTGENARESAVRKMPAPTLLHFATHGCFMDDAAGSDPMLRSFLVLAGANDLSASIDPLDDGKLTAYEVSALRLPAAELVVLSACETGLGDVRNGEGVFGLRRAFQLAGARAIMMSLWKVPDADTLLLMERFYHHWLAGLDKHAALRQAQRDVRDAGRRTKEGSLPSQWGGFVLVGS